MRYPIVQERNWRRQETTPVVPPPSSTPTDLPTSDSSTTPPTVSSSSTISVPYSSSTPPVTSPPTSLPPSSTPEVPPTSPPVTSNPGGTTVVPPTRATTTPVVPPTSSGAATPTLVTSSVQSVITSVVTVTNSNGQVLTSTSVMTSTVPVVTELNSGGSSGSGKSNTGPIVGGVIGGIAGLGLLLLLIWWLRRKKDIKLDENIFDPDRNVQRPGRLHGDVDLADVDAEAHPYNYQSPNNRPLSGGSGPEMRQQYPAYGDSPYPVAGRPTSQYGSHISPNPSDGTDGRSTLLSPGSSSGAPMIAGGAYAASSTGTGTTSQHPRSAKDREIAARRALHVASSTDDDGSSPVTQHQDGGRMVEPDAPREVPPAYDSIPRGEPSGSGPAGPGSPPPGDAKGPRL